MTADVKYKFFHTNRHHNNIKFQQCNSAECFCNRCHNQPPSSKNVLYCIGSFVANRVLRQIIYNLKIWNCNYLDYNTSNTMHVFIEGNQGFLRFPSHNPIYCFRIISIKYSIEYSIKGNTNSFIHVIALNYLRFDSFHDGKKVWKYWNYCARYIHNLFPKAIYHFV